MDLAADLGYTHSSANPLQRLVRWGAGTRAGGGVYQRADKSDRHGDVPCAEPPEEVGPPCPDGARRGWLGHWRGHGVAGGIRHNISHVHRLRREGWFLTEPGREVDGLYTK